MPNYELVFLVRQDLSEGRAKTLSEEIEQILTNNGGSVVFQEYWGLRNLAYKINKNRKAHYFYFEVSVSPEGLHETERRMRLHEDILRHLTVRVEELKKDTTPVLRGETPRRGRDKSEQEAA